MKVFVLYSHHLKFKTQKHQVNLIQIKIQLLSSIKTRIYLFSIWAQMQ